MQPYDDNPMVSMQTTDEERINLLGQSGSININTDESVTCTPPEEKFLCMFPAYLEKKFEKFDDFGMFHVQKIYNKVIYWVDLMITGMVAIEISFVAPFMLFIVGLDGLATEFAYLALILAFVSQIPKRFLWRFRPYMVRRAKFRKKDMTSSFPSRAVTCAVVYSYAAAYAFIFYQDSFQLQWWMFLLLFVAVALSSFARMNLGVHYPSDCVGGVLQGAVVCVMGTGLWKADMLGCPSCHAQQCYSLPPNNLHWNSLQHLDFKVMGIVFGASIVLMVVSVIRPIHFWGKCDRVYGMILPTILFQVGFLCPSGSQLSLGSPGTPEWFTYPFAAAVAALAMGVSFKANGKYPYLVFGFLYILIFFSITLWRLAFV